MHQHYWFFHLIELYPSNSNLNAINMCKFISRFDFRDIKLPQLISNLCYYNLGRYELSYLQYISIFYAFPNSAQLAFPLLFRTMYILFLDRDIQSLDSRLISNSWQKSVRISLLPGKISIISVTPSARDNPKNWKKIKNFLIYELRILLYLNCAINHYLHLEMSHLLHFVICTWYVCTKYRTTKIFELMTHQWWRNSWCHIFTEESSG